jgi:hypothetical protein
MNKNVLVILCVTLISFLLSAFVLYTPIPSASADGFSAVYAASYIMELSREPHSVFEDSAHEDVRQYLKETLEEYVGVANVAEMDYTAEELGHDTVYGIRNLLATIPGTSDTAILLVAHYDSRGQIGRSGELGRSYGAADDGYGLATILEIARLYGERNDLENTIYLLMTDGEETGLFGAEMAASESFIDNVGFIINLEARGVDGPAYMFETSTNNATVIDFYRNAELPVSYSLATAVYTVMPNSTDFTEFLAVGKQGINFAVLKGLYNYHTPFDTYTAIDLSSIQHYGSQVLPLVDEFVTNPEYADVNYFVSDQNQIFFTVLPNLFVSYTETLGSVMNIIGVLLFIGLVVFLTLKRQLKPLKILQYFGLIFAAIAVFAIVGLFLSKLIAWLGGTNWSLTYVRMVGSELPTLLIMLGTVFVLGLLLKKKVKAEDYTSVMLAGIFLNLLFATLTGFVLSGASFLFFVPAIIGLYTLYLVTFVKNRIFRHLALSHNLFYGILIVVPILYSLFLALTVGGLLALLVILIITSSIVLPSVMIQSNLE